MDLSEKLRAEPWPNSSLTANNSQQQWQNNSISFQQFYNQSTETQYFIPSNPNNQIPMKDDSSLQTNRILDWDPRAMLNNLSFLEQKIHQLQDLVQLIAARKGEVNELAFQQQQQLVTTDLTSIIVQLISTAGSLLPSGQSTPVIGPSKETLLPPRPAIDVQSQTTCDTKANEKNPIEDHDLKDEEEIEEGENLPTGSFEILQLEKEEILAPHTHFCSICGKGFKRDANLRMHMRGHGDEYKTAAALAKPNKEAAAELAPLKRYSCPFAGCKRNKDHKKFQPLKTILCVKNHYKRTHCDKSYTCSRCNTKKFSVIADLKTHEKHCGREKWLCSCGTTFSRKDKLFGHIALFQGHTPAIPPDEMKAMARKSDKGADNEVKDKDSGVNCSFGDVNMMEVNVKESGEDLNSCFSPLDFDSCNFGDYTEFARPSYDDTESSFSFLISGNYSEKNGGDSGL